MADEKPINPILKQVLELGPTIAFFLIYLGSKKTHSFWAERSIRASSWRHWCLFPFCW